MYERILVPTDGSDCSMHAADRAFELADAFDAEVHALHVVDDRAAYGDAGMDFDGTDVLDYLRDAGERAIDRFEQRAADAGVRTTTAIESGVPHREILRYVGDHGIDLVVVGTHGRTGLDRLLLGSVAEKVVRLCEVPVMTVREESE